MSSSHFDAKGLYTLVEQMAYPRFIGTPGEKRVIAQIKTEFQKRGFGPADVTSQHINPTTWMASIFLQSLTGTIAAIIFGILLTWTYAGPLFLWIWLAAFITAAIFFVSRMDSTRWTVGTVETENIFVRVPPQKEKHGTILFSGHFDTKSQSYPAFVRAVFYVLGILLGVPFLLVMLVNLLLVTFGQPDNAILSILAQVLGWPAGACFFLLLFNLVGNKSVGAADNATGTAIVLELARYFKERGGLDHYETIFAAFAAEEVGVVGSAFWAKEYGSNLDPATAYMFNFDMVGKPGLQYMGYIGFRKKPTNRKLNPLVVKIASELNIPMATFWMPIGAMTDRFPFAKRGWEGVDIISRTLAMQAHTTRDTMAGIDGELLAQACEIARMGAERIDQGKF